MWPHMTCMTDLLSWRRKQYNRGQQANNNCGLDITEVIFGQIHFVIWTNTFYNLDKYISQFGQIWFAHSRSWDQGKAAQGGKKGENVNCKPQGGEHNPYCSSYLTLSAFEVECGHDVTIANKKDNYDWNSTRCRNVFVRNDLVAKTWRLRWAIR